MKIDRVINVERSEQREHEGLDPTDQQLQRVNEDDEYKCQDTDTVTGSSSGVKALHYKIAEYVKQDMAGKHGDEGTKTKAEWPHQEGNKLNRCDEYLER